MVTFEFLKQVGNVLFYTYYPEKNGSPGEISISRDGENWDITKKSSDDFLLNYAGHAAHNIAKQLKNGDDIPKSGMSAWY